MDAKVLCLAGALITAVLFAASRAQGRVVNYDEGGVRPYTLPDPLSFADGRRVRDAKRWMVRRRPEILRLFASEVYGRGPGRSTDMSFRIVSVDSQAHLNFPDRHFKESK